MQGINGWTVSPNPRKRGKSHHHHALNYLLKWPTSILLQRNKNAPNNKPSFSVTLFLLSFFLCCFISVLFLLTFNTFCCLKRNLFGRASENWSISHKTVQNKSLQTDQVMTNWTRNRPSHHKLNMSLQTDQAITKWTSHSKQTMSLQTEQIIRILSLFILKQSGPIQSLHVRW